MTTLEPYLFFDGNCAEAMRFYERVLGGKVEVMMTHGKSPMGAQCSPGNKDRIMHARIVIGGHSVMASDSMSEEKWEGMKGFSLALGYPSNAEAQRVFTALCEGGQVIMPVSKTFWAEAFGMLVDRFGTSWMVSGPPSKF